MKRNTAVIDLHGCNYLGEIHGRIKSALNFPAHYGENWSAFWDFLWSECDADKVIIKGERTLPKEFNESIVKMHEILERNAHFRKENSLNSFSFEIVN